MKHILMLTTGGTIASDQSDHGLQPAHSGDALITAIPELKHLCRITCRELFQLDSTNICPENWITIAQTVCTSLENFDGIVITHGTDTMAYTAGALSFMLQNLHKPVILTGSQRSITEKNTDAKRNLLDAFRTAITGIPGVYIVFYGKIMRGTRAKKLYTKQLNAFHSINAEDVGQIHEDGTVTFPPFSFPEEPFSPDLCLDPHVCALKLLPGTDPALLHALIHMGYRAIILEAFGCGGIPNQQLSLLPCLKEAKKQGVLIVIASQCLYESVDLTLYDVNVRAAKLGALSGYDMTLEALTAKLMWILGHTSDPKEIQKMLSTCYAGELTENQI